MKLAFVTKLTPREKKIFGVVVALLVLMMGYHGVWTPVAQKLGQLDDEIFAMEMKLRKAKTHIRQREDIVEESKKFPNLEQIDGGTDEEEIARLLNLIEQTARKDGVSLSDVKPQPVKSDKTTKRFEVELNAESALEQMISFIYDLEHSPELLKIERVDTSPKEENSPVLRSSFVVARVVMK